MTKSKREPFAAIPHRFNGWITVGPCSFLTMMSGDDLRGDVDSINAAFNARVDEEVRKAVEEFRERAARSVEVADLFEDVENGCPAEMPEATRPGFSAVGWIAKKIRALPTEPERGKE